MRKRLFIALALLAIAVSVGMLARRSGPEALVFQGKSVSTWARQCLAPTQPERDEATAAFKALGSKAVPGLMRLVAARDSIFRRAVWAQGPRLPAPLARILLRAVHPPDASLVRKGAVRGLAAVGPAAEPAIPLLAAALNSTEMDLRWEAGLALGHVGRPAVWTLAPALSSTNFHVRHCAVTGLGLLGEDALPAAGSLLKALDDKNGIAVSAAACLAKLGTNVVPFLTNEMASPDPLVRQRATHGLGVVHPRRSLLVPPLLEMLHDQEPSCRIAALREFAMLGLPDARMVKACVAGLDDPDREVRLAAIQALAQARFHSALVVPEMTARLNDESAAVRAAAARLLGSFGLMAQAASEPLRERLGDKDESVRTAAQAALEKINAPAPAATAAGPK